MSIPKTQPTNYHTTPQRVDYRLEAIRLDELRDLQRLRVWGSLVGTVPDTTGHIASYEAAMKLTEVKAGFTVQERQAARVFIAAAERELGKKVATLEGLPHDDTDVFVDNS